MRILALLAMPLLVTNLGAGVDNTQSIAVGEATLTLGMTPSAVRSQLGEDHHFGWQRDKLPKPVESTTTPHGVTYRSRISVAGKPATLNYADDHGEHAYIANPQGTPIAALVFEGGKLTRATRFVALQNESSTRTASWLMAAVAPILAAWETSGQPVSVRASHFAHGRETVDEMVFESGPRQLVVLTTGGRTSVVENLGRGDIPSISTTP